MIDKEEPYELLAADLQRGGVVVLCGAGISASPPSCIPLGGEVAAAFQRAIEAAVNSAGLNGMADWRFIGKMMPERILSAFYAIFGFGAFEFMDSWFDRQPNCNHLNLVRLVSRKHIESVVTLNFDFLFEVAWHRTTGCDVFPSTNFEQLVQPPYVATWLHKPHGSLFGDRMRTASRQRYDSILFTLERLGTALDDNLVEWFRKVIGCRPLLVTGYSAGDLDIFPALCEARRRSTVDEGQKGGRVYWTYRNAGKLANTVRLKPWLENLEATWCPLPGDIENHLAAVMTRLDLKPYVPDAAPCSEPRGLETLGRIETDVSGVLLAAALVMHSANQWDQHRAESAILTYLQREGIVDLDSEDYRKATMLAQLTADRFMEEGNAREAVKWYTRSAARVADHADTEPIAAEVTPGQIRCKLAHARLNPLRATSSVLRLLIAPHAFFMLWCTARGWWNPRPETQRLSAHFLGNLFYTMAMSIDAVFPMIRLPALLYRYGLYNFRLATKPLDNWKSRDAFHYFRADEVWLLLRRLSARTSRSLPAPIDLRQWDQRFAHYSYLARVLSDDVHLAGAVGCFAGLRKGLESDRECGQASPKTWTLLHRAGELFHTREYGAGMVRLQLYVWLCETIHEYPRWSAVPGRLWRLFWLRRRPRHYGRILLDELKAKLPTDLGEKPG